MGYYLRILTSKVSLIPTLLGDDDPWKQVVVRHTGGEAICAVECCTVTEMGPGRDEIDDFLEEMKECLPRSGAAWVASYLASVRTIYSFQILDGAYETCGWEVVDLLKSKIWNIAGGILQADREGFSNEDGYHAVWQFSDGVGGDWWMALLDGSKWVHFQMDLGDIGHRDAFLRGEIPAGLSPAGQRL
jgi:hypothetical protein